MLHAARQPRSWLIFDVDIAACNQAEKRWRRPQRWGGGGERPQGGGSGQGPGINACVDANRGGNRDRADLRGLDTNSTMVRHARTVSATYMGAAQRPRLRGTSIVHGPAAQSLTTAAARRRAKNERTSVGFLLFQPARATEVAAGRGRRVAERETGVVSGGGTWRSRSQTKPASSRASATLIFAAMTPRCVRCQ
jgi:hypothetical protein